VNIVSAASFSPNANPTLAKIGSLAMPSGSNLNLNLNSPYAVAGTDFDQLDVVGTVNITGVNLVLSGGAAAPAAGTSGTLINNDGTDAVVGTFNGRAQGSTVTIGSFTGIINYFGGDGNDVTLIVTGAPTYTETVAGASFELRRVNSPVDQIQLLRNTLVI